jgi:hypothetical protein
MNGLEEQVGNKYWIRLHLNMINFRLFLIWKWTSVSSTMREISWPSERLSVSQEDLCSLDLISILISILSLNYCVLYLIIFQWQTSCGGLCTVIWAPVGASHLLENNKMLEKSFASPATHINLATAHYTARHETLQDQMSSALQNIKSLRIPDRILNSIKKNTYILSLPIGEPDISMQLLFMTASH